MVSVPVPIPAGIPIPIPHIPRIPIPPPPGKVPGIPGSSAAWLTPAAACTLLGTNCFSPFASDADKYRTATTGNFKVEIRSDGYFWDTKPKRDSEDKFVRNELNQVLFEFKEERDQNWSFNRAYFFYNAKITNISLEVPEESEQVASSRYTIGFKVSYQVNGFSFEFSLAMVSVSNGTPIAMKV